MSFQTRNDEECQYHDSLLQAYQAWENDKGIWKISYDDGKPHRWIRSRDERSWIDRPLVPVVNVVDGECDISFSIENVLTNLEFRDFCINK